MIILNPKSNSGGTLKMNPARKLKLQVFCSFKFLVAMNTLAFVTMPHGLSMVHSSRLGNLLETSVPMRETHTN